MLRRFSVNFALVAMLADTAAVALGLLLAATLRPALNSLSFVMPIQGPITIPPPLYVLLPVTWVVIIAALSLYDGRKYLRTVDEFSGLTLAVMIAAISSAGVLYLSFRDVSRALFITFVALTYLLCVLWRALARVIVQRRRGDADPARRVLLVGGGVLGQRVRAQLDASPHNGLRVIGFVDDDPSAADPHVPLLGCQSQIRRIVQAHDVSDVVIALPHSSYDSMDDTVKQLEGCSVRVWIALGFAELALYRTVVEDLAGIPLIDLRASAIDDYERLLKRGFDIVVGLAALVVATPVMLLSALAVLAEDGRPVLFRQTRVGENGRAFDMIKLRTMIRNAEALQPLVEKQNADGTFSHKSHDDPRVLRVGRLLRRFSLDELPQLLNVLRGEMSLVGPRPEMPYLVDRYESWQRQRFAVPPGITGWWQVSGRSDRPMHLHTEDDLYYIRNYSVWLDVQIMMKTVWEVMIGRGSY